METNDEPRVEYGRGHALAIAALFAGVTLAIGVSAVVLGLGHSLTPAMQVWLVVLAVCFGGVTSLTAAFFGCVIPSSVGGKWDYRCERHAPHAPKTEAAE